VAKKAANLSFSEFGPEYSRLKDLGRLYEKTGNLKQAIVNYKKALKFKPENPDLALLIGVSKRRAGQREKARKVFRDILGFKPGWYGSHINLAEMDIEDADFAAAEKHFKQIDISFPGNSRVMINRADILIKEGRPEEALAICREGAAATAFYYTDELSLGHRVQGDAHAALGNKEEARYHRLMAKRIKGSSDFFAATIGAADEKIVSGDLDLAEKIADGLLSRFPMNSLAYIKKAEIARIRGQIDEALSFAGRAAREDNPKYLNDKIRGLELLADLYNDKGMADESARYLQQISELTYQYLQIMTSRFQSAHSGLQSDQSLHQPFPLRIVFLHPFQDFNHLFISSRIPIDLLQPLIENTHIRIFFNQTTVRPYRQTDIPGIFMEPGNPPLDLSDFSELIGGHLFQCQP